MNVRLLSTAAFLVLAARTATPLDAQSARLLRQPTVSQNQVAFAYAGDIWLGEPAVPPDGSPPCPARRAIPTSPPTGYGLPWFG